jgi:hypothetical protein
LTRETEVLGENPPQCPFVHQKPHMLYPDANPGRRGGKPATNRLSYGTARFAGLAAQNPRGSGNDDPWIADHGVACAGIF